MLEAAKAQLHLSATRNMTAFLLASYIILPTVSFNIFSMFACEKFDDGSLLLRIDYQVERAST